MVDIDHIAHVIGAWRFPLSDEKALQASIGDALTAAGIEHRREVRLAPGDIIDLLVGTIGIEVKLKGSRRDIFKQCARYLGYPALTELMLVTNLPMGLPAGFHGKPLRRVDLGRAWL